MKFLIISRCFPPDTSIGGIRPFMFAKYMIKFGHEVTIINSGLVFAKEDKSYEEQLNGMRIISVYNRKPTPNINAPKRSWKDTAPQIIKNLYLALREPAIILREKRHFNSLFKEYKSIIDKLKGEHFDVVFSTYSPIADIYAGDYASRLFGCKWIMDFRDALVQPSSRSWLWNTCFYNTQRWAVKKCDVCTTVSNGVGRMVSIGTKKANIVTLYNGYDDERQIGKTHTSDALSLCYTGNIYGMRMAAMRMILLAITKLNQSGQIELDNIKIKYAGGKEEELKGVLKEYGLETILDNHGYLSIAECEDLQRNSDLFVVLSWNTKKEQGILTGKFFEGIRAEMPMLVSVVGDTPNSELSELNNEYHYGICVEEAAGEASFDILCQYLKQKYDEKMSFGQLKYKQDKRLTDKFKYINLTRELETLCQQMMKQ